MYQTRQSGASIDRVRGFRTLLKVQQRGQWRALGSVARYDKSSRLAADYHYLSLALRNKLETVVANPSARKRMTGKYMLDVFGGHGFLAKASNHLGLRGYVLDAKFGSRYDVTKPLVLTRIRQDVSSGKCVAGMISPPRQHNVVSASAAVADVLHLARMPWIVEHPCGSWLWDVPKTQSPAVQPRSAFRRLRQKSAWLLMIARASRNFTQVGAFVCHDKALHDIPEAYTSNVQQRSECRRIFVAWHCSPREMVLEASMYRSRRQMGCWSDGS